MTHGIGHKLVGGNGLGTPPFLQRHIAKDGRDELRDVVGGKPLTLERKFARRDGGCLVI